MSILNRRKYPRIRIYLPICLQGQGLETIETLAKDIALDGMRCLSPHSCPEGTLLSAELLVGHAQAPIRISAKVIWCKESPGGEQCDLGLHFVKISDENMQRLSTYLNHFSSRQRTEVPA